MQDAKVAGALFDFAGYLTTLETPLTLGATKDASPAVYALQEWARSRGFELEPADVIDWHKEPVGGGLTVIPRCDITSTMMLPDGRVAHKCICGWRTGWRLNAEEADSAYLEHAPTQNGISKQATPPPNVEG